MLLQELYKEYMLAMAGGHLLFSHPRVFSLTRRRIAGLIDGLSLLDVFLPSASLVLSTKAIRDDDTITSPRLCLVGFAPHPTPTEKVKKGLSSGSTAVTAACVRFDPISVFNNTTLKAPNLYKCQQ